MNDNLPNGISQFHIKQPELSSRHFNGLGSTDSSRDPSPSTRFQNIPSAQLPPSRTSIPASQLPISRPISNIKQLTKNYANLNVSGLTTTDSTPFSSPKIQTFSTSTPVIENKEREVTVGAGDSNVTNIAKSVLSPIVSNTQATSSKQTSDNKEPITTTFTHSATSQFTNVTRNASTDSNNLLLTGKKDMASLKSDENTQRTFDSNLFATSTSTGPILPGGKPPEQPISSNLTRSTVPKPLYQSQNDFPVQGQIINTTNQNLANRFTNTEQPHTSQGNQQLPGGMNHNQSFQQISQPVNNNQPLNTMNVQQNHAMSTRPPPNQPGSFQNFSQNQLNPQIRPKMQTSVSQSQMNTPNAPYPMGMQSQQRQIPPNSVQGQYSDPQNYGSMPNLQRPNFPIYGQGNTQIPPQIPVQSTNQTVPSMPPQLNQNLPPTPMQNQSRAYLHNNRYPTQQVTPQSMQSFQQQQQPQIQHPSLQANYPNQQFQYANTQQAQQNFTQQARPSITQSGFNKLWGRENFDLLQTPNILPQTKLEAPKVSLGQEFLDAINCNADIFRCTMTKIPETTSLLQKSRLPLGVLIHPFKDLNHLPVIQCNTIVRCRACRTYINPFVFFADSKRWKCNLCYRINDLPDEFQFDPVTKTYGDPSRRPEVKSSTIEYIAPAEYMLRPPQPAVYLFLMDISRLAIESGYLHTVCSILSSELINLPGDARTQIGFLAYDSALHFYSLSEGQNQPHEMTILDIDDVFLPCPDNLLVNLQDRMEMINDLLTQLPTRYLNTYETSSALGAALQIGYKMMSATGGRITVFQATLPNIGPGALTPREDPNQRSAATVPHLNPANDFYKRLALECSGQQIAVDLFVLNSQYIDLATISGISRFSGGCIHHFPLFKASRTLQNDAFERTFRRYVTRKIGFEAVMRIRCTRGLSIHTFHGNFFVRSTDLLSLPNINPDAGFGMQVSIEENLTDVQTVCFQAALLYTSSKGERRIRVHTMCLPVANNLTDVINSADQQCIIGLLSKMAVDRSMQSSLSDAREAFINVAIDILSSYKLSLNLGSSVNGLMAPECLKLLPLYISALLKNIAFRIGISTRLDDRVKAMCDMKTKPLPYLLQHIYPDLYPIHNLQECNVIVTEDDETIHQPPHLQLTARSLDSNGAYLLDMAEHMIVFVCANVSSTFLNDVLDVPDFGALSDEYYELPILENQHSKRIHSFVNYLHDEKPFQATIQVIRENSPNRALFYERLIEDRLENSLSYHEFLQHIKTQVK